MKYIIRFVHIDIKYVMYSLCEKLCFALNVWNGNAILKWYFNHFVKHYSKIYGEKSLIYKYLLYKTAQLWLKTNLYFLQAVTWRTLLATIVSMCWQLAETCPSFQFIGIPYQGLGVCFRPLCSGHKLKHKSNGIKIP